MTQETISTQEEIVLLSVGSLEPAAYAYGIQKEIKREANLNWSIGTIHTILYRLENKGLLKSEMGGSSEKRGGRSKRLYSLTAKGYGNVQSIQETRQAMWNKLVTNKPSF
ncbi:PadR family transcriptional regulator [Roseivirga sp.]|uniref:PadR family transcriptional regulator n=1 Tax=Roseivirga sp. TaxID=1964215 RepID=UPI003B8B7C33